MGRGCAMGQPEIALAAAGGGMATVVWLGVNLVSAIWRGRLPRPVPLAATVGLIVLAMITLSTYSSPPQPVLVASASESEAHREPLIEIHTAGASIRGSDQ